MVADQRSPFGWKSLACGVLAGVLLMCLPEAWAEKLRGVVHDGLSPGQCVVAATIPQAVSPAGRLPDARSHEAAWEQQARYWQVEAARLRAELDELRKVPGWPAVEQSAPLVTPRLQTARVIGWERPSLADWPTAVLRGGISSGIQAGDMVLAAGESILDRGKDGGVSQDDLVLAGRCVIGRIQQASRWTSTIQSVTDPEYRGHAQIIRIQDGEAILGAEGTITGSDGRSCRLLHIDATEPVTEGDLVFSALRGVPLSPPLFYGTVTHADLDSNESHWSIDVHPACNGPPPGEVLVLQLMLSSVDEP